MTHPVKLESLCFHSMRIKSPCWMLPSSVVRDSQQMMRMVPHKRMGAWTISKFKIAFGDSWTRVVSLGVSREGPVLMSLMLLDERESNTNSQCCWAPGQDQALNMTSGRKHLLLTCWQFISRWGLMPAPCTVSSIFPLWNCRQLVCRGSAGPINIYTFYSHSSQSL